MNDMWWQSVKNLAAQVPPLLDEARGLQRTIVEAQSCRAALEAFDRLERLLDHPRAAAALLARTHPHEGVRRDALGAHQAFTGFLSELLREPAVLAALQLDEPELDEDARALRDQLVVNCRRAGAERTPAERDRIASLQPIIARIGALYRRTLRGSPPELPVGGDDALAGMPAAWSSTHVSHATDPSTVRLTQGLSTAVLVQCDNEATRRRCWEVLNQHGWPDNGPVLKQLLGARAEVAECLGFANWSALELSFTMAGELDRVAAFLRRVEASARAAAEREDGRLLGATSADQLQPWNRLYLRRIAMAEEAQPRGGTTLAQLLSTARDLLRRVLGWDVEMARDVPVWVRGVEVWEITRNGEPIGRIFLDVQPRAAKAGGATTMRVRTGVAGQVLPEVALIASLPEDVPLGHTEVVAVFHELGHAVHHIAASEATWIGLNGIPHGRDVAELAPQIFETWAWEPEVLEALGWESRDRERLLKAEQSTRGTRVMRQLLYAAYSVELHREDPGSLDLDAFDEAIFDRYGDGAQSAERLYAHFLHLIAYGATYFAYEWSRAMARDVLAQLSIPTSRPGALSPFVDGVLRQGKRGAAQDAVSRLLGRPWSLQAYVDWLEEA